MKTQRLMYATKERVKWKEINFVSHSLFGGIDDSATISNSKGYCHNM